EALVVEGDRAHLAEPVPERLLVQGALQPSRQVAPEGFGSQLFSVLHAGSGLLGRWPGGGENSTAPPACSMRISRPKSTGKWPDLQGKSSLHIPLHSCGNSNRPSGFSRTFHDFPRASPCGQPPPRSVRVYWPFG